MLTVRFQREGYPMVFVFVAIIEIVQEIPVTSLWLQMALVGFLFHG